MCRDPGPALISVTPSGTTGNSTSGFENFGETTEVAVSADGRYVALTAGGEFVAFTSRASNLTSNTDSNFAGDAGCSRGGR